MGNAYCNIVNDSGHDVEVCTYNASDGLFLEPFNSYLVSTSEVKRVEAAADWRGLTVCVGNTKTFVENGASVNASSLEGRVQRARRSLAERQQAEDAIGSGKAFNQASVSPNLSLADLKKKEQEHLEALIALRQRAEVLEKSEEDAIARQMRLEAEVRAAESSHALQVERKNSSNSHSERSPHVGNSNGGRSPHNGDKDIAASILVCPEHSSFQGIPTFDSVHDANTEGLTISSYLSHGRIVAFKLAGSTPAAATDHVATPRGVGTKERDRFVYRALAHCGDERQECGTLQGEYNAWKQKYSIRTETSEWAEGLVELHNRQARRVAEALIALELAYPRESVVAILRLHDRPTEYVKPVRFGEVVLVWSPQRDGGGLSMADRRTTSAVTVSQLLKWCSAHGCTSQIVYRTDIGDRSSFRFDQVFRKLFLEGAIVS